MVDIKKVVQMLIHLIEEQEKVNINYTFADEDDSKEVKAG